MSPNRIEHSTTDTCINWMKQPIIGRCHLANNAIHDRCHRGDAHMPWLIHTHLRCCCMSLKNVACLMRVNQCHLSNALKPLLMLPSWCAQYMGDTCRFWLMLQSIGPHCIEDAHVPHPCMHASVDVHAISRRHYMPLADVACNMWPCHIIWM